MSRTLIESLLRGMGLPDRQAETELIETHISWVILAGDWTYKIKKPVVRDIWISRRWTVVASAVMKNCG